MFKKLSQKIKKDQRGLTLVELLAVVVILAIISAVAFVIIGNVIANTKQDAHVANAQQAIAATKIAESSGDIDFSEKKEWDLLDLDGNGKKLNTIGSMSDPWNKAKYSKISVEKKEKMDSNNQPTGESEYIVKITAAAKGTGASAARPDVENKCDLSTGKSQEVLQEGRKEACK